jgi:hypothetical protein
VTYFRFQSTASWSAHADVDSVGIYSSRRGDLSTIGSRYRHHPREIAAPMAAR